MIYSSSSSNWFKGHNVLNFFSASSGGEHANANVASDHGKISV